MVAEPLSASGEAEAGEGATNGTDLGGWVETISF